MVLGHLQVKYWCKITPVFYKVSLVLGNTESSPYNITQTAWQDLINYRGTSNVNIGGMTRQCCVVKCHHHFCPPTIWRDNLPHFFTVGWWEADIQILKVHIKCQLHDVCNLQNSRHYILFAGCFIINMLCNRLQVTPLSWLSQYGGCWWPGVFLALGHLSW